jgi:phospholipase A-2-activating protein
MVTGASRYQSSASSVPPAGNPSDYADPFTGASRYSGAPLQAPPPAPLPPKPALPMVITTFHPTPNYY